jgi:hypothetical protein
MNNLKPLQSVGSFNDARTQFEKSQPHESGLEVLKFVWVAHVIKISENGRGRIDVGIAAVFKDAVVELTARVMSSHQQQARALSQLTRRG